MAHAAYWKSRVRRRITGEPKPAFELSGANWFRFDGVPTPADWKQEKERLTREHAALLAAVRAAGDRLDEPAA